MNFDKEENPHLSLCLCLKCKEVLRRPISITPCGHLFSYNCILPDLQGKVESATLCPECKTIIYKNSIISPKHTQKLIEVLQIECDYCYKKFKIKEYKGHEYLKQNPRLSKFDFNLV